MISMFKRIPLTDNYNFSVNYAVCNVKKIFSLNGVTLYTYSRHKFKFKVLNPEGF